MRSVIVPRTRYRIREAESAHFLTCSVVSWLPVFSLPACAEIVLDSLQYLQEHGRLTLYGYVLMETHLHLIASAPDLPTTLRDFKAFTARNVVAELDASNVRWILQVMSRNRLRHRTQSRHQFWQEGSHPQLILGDAMMRQKMEYMHNNPMRRGYVDDPEHWRYSSARDYAGETGIVRIETAWWEPDQGPK